MLRRRFPSMGSMPNLALPFLLAAVTVFQGGCGGGGSGASMGSSSASPNPSPATPSVTVMPASTSVTQGETLSTTVTVSGKSSTPTGSVVLSSGNFASFSTTLNGGSAAIGVPVALLAAGSATLTATYTPDSASSSEYAVATGAVALTVAAPAGSLTVSATDETYPTVGPPFQAAVTSSGTVLVSVASQGIQVFAPGANGLTPVCVNALPSSVSGEGAAAADLSFIPDGTDVAVGIGSPGASFFNVAALETCSAAGYVVSQGTIASDQGTLAVVATPDGDYAFVANEYGVAAGASTEGSIGVVQLQYDANGDVGTGTTLLGQISTGGLAIAGMTLSPDGKRLYVTSEVSASSAAAGGNNSILSEDDCVQVVGSTPQRNGLLTVINVATAESSPGPSAIVSTVDAGCSPVRMAETADQSTLWVAARGDNRVLAFSTGMLESNPGNALLGYAGTGGTAPVGINLFHNDQLLVVANSNRFGAGPTANAAILDVAVPASASVVQTVPTGLFPREVSVGPDGATLYLTNYDSDTLEVISTDVQ